jgi:hypothetical protein
VAPAQQEKAIPMDCGLPEILVKNKKMLEFPVLGFSYGPPLSSYFILVLYLLGGREELEE